MIILGILLAFIDFATYGFNYYNPITILGYVVYFIAFMLFILGIIFLFILIYVFGFKL